MDTSDLGWAIGVVFRSYLKVAEELFADLPGGPRGHQVLSAAVHDSPRHQLALAQHLGVDRTVMTYLIDDLVEAGLVERRPDPDDRRARLVAPTTRGRQVLRRLEARLRRAEDHLLAALSPDDRDEFRRLLHQVARQVHLLDPVANTCEVVEEIAAATQNSRSSSLVSPRSSS